MKSQISKTKLSLYVVSLIIFSLTALFFSLQHIAPELKTVAIGTLQKESSEFCLKFQSTPISKVTVQLQNVQVTSITISGEIILHDVTDVLKYQGYATFGPRGKLYAFNLEVLQGDTRYVLNERGTESAIFEYTKAVTDHIVESKNFYLTGPLLLLVERQDEKASYDFFIPEHIIKSNSSFLGELLKASLSPFTFQKIGDQSSCHIKPLTETNVIKKIKEMHSTLMNEDLLR